MEHGHGRNREDFGVVGECFVLRAALEHEDGANDHKNNDEEEENQEKGALPRGRGARIVFKMGRNVSHVQ
jgi:hypothetical protein